jgi:hypothetical protein
VLGLPGKEIVAGLLLMGMAVLVVAVLALLDWQTPQHLLA